MSELEAAGALAPRGRALVREEGAGMEEGRLELEEHNTCWCCGGVGFVLCP
jgi:hypothetical protein